VAVGEDDDDAHVQAITVPSASPLKDACVGGDNWEGGVPERIKAAQVDAETECVILSSEPFLTYPYYTMGGEGEGVESLARRTEPTQDDDILDPMEALQALAAADSALAGKNRELEASNRCVAELEDTVLDLAGRLASLVAGMREFLTLGGEQEKRVSAAEGILVGLATSQLLETRSLGLREAAQAQSLRRMVVESNSGGMGEMAHQSHSPHHPRLQKIPSTWAGVVSMTPQGVPLAVTRQLSSVTPGISHANPITPTPVRRMEVLDLKSTVSAARGYAKKLRRSLSQGPTLSPSSPPFSVGGVGDENINSNNNSSNSSEPTSPCTNPLLTASTLLSRAPPAAAAPHSTTTTPWILRPDPRAPSSIPSPPALLGEDAPSPSTMGGGHEESALLRASLGKVVKEAEGLLRGGLRVLKKQLHVNRCRSEQLQRELDAAEPELRKVALYKRSAETLRAKLGGGL